MNNMIRSYSFLITSTPVQFCGPISICLLKLQCLTWNVSMFDSLSDWVYLNLNFLLITVFSVLLGLGFVTSIAFIFLVGVFMSSWLGASVLGLGEWFIKRMPFVRHIYNASKQISSAISPGMLLLKFGVSCMRWSIWQHTDEDSFHYTDQNTQAFKEVAIIRHPRVGEYAFGFITSSLTLQVYKFS